MIIHNWKHRAGTKQLCLQICRLLSTEVKLDKALLLMKLSRLEMEKLRYPELNDKQLKKLLVKKGKDYSSMLKHHELNKKFQEKVIKTFDAMKINMDVVNRFNYTKEKVTNSDVIFPIGGDGTFLLAASCVPDSNKPIIGFNSDPCRSEGHLCLPKQYSEDLNSALAKLIEGHFKWMFRTRIRVTLCGSDLELPYHLHEEGLQVKDNFISERRNEFKVLCEGKAKAVLPVRALNEVFLGEITSAKVSYFEMHYKNQPVKIKSSGICVCTGTGSTSWNMSINRMPAQSVEIILKLYSKQTGQKVDLSNIRMIRDQFNEKFKFAPDDPRICYTIRDLISAGVWPNPKGLIGPRAFVQSLLITSKCTDAGLVVDGGISFPFNDGTAAILEVFPEDSLRTVVLN